MLLLLLLVPIVGVGVDDDVVIVAVVGPPDADAVSLAYAGGRVMLGGRPDVKAARRPACVLSWLRRLGFIDGEALFGFEPVAAVVLVPLALLRVEFVRETAAEGGRDDLDDFERAEEVEGAAETRRDMAGEGGAGRDEDNGPGEAP